LQVHGLGGRYIRSAASGAVSGPPRTRDLRSRDGRYWPEAGLYSSTAPGGSTDIGSAAADGDPRGMRARCNCTVWFETGERNRARSLGFPEFRQHRTGRMPVAYRSHARRVPVSGCGVAILQLAADSPVVLGTRGSEAGVRGKLGRREEGLLAWRYRIHDPILSISISCRVFRATEQFPQFGRNEWPTVPLPCHVSTKLRIVLPLHGLRRHVADDPVLLAPANESARMVGMRQRPSRQHAPSRLCCCLQRQLWLRFLPPHGCPLSYAASATAAACESIQFLTTDAFQTRRRGDRKRGLGNVPCLARRLIVAGCSRVAAATSAGVRRLSPSRAATRALMLVD